MTNANDRNPAPDSKGADVTDRPRVIRQRSRRTITEHYVTYAYANTPSAGFTFPADEHGNVLVKTLAPAGRDSYEACLTGVVDGERVTGPSHQANTRTIVEPAILECSCGRHVALTTNDNECDCGRIYNAFGQALAPRHTWEPDDPYYDED